MAKPRRSKKGPCQDPASTAASPPPPFVAIEPPVSSASASACVPVSASPSRANQRPLRDSLSATINRIDARPHLEGTQPLSAFTKTSNTIFSALAQSTVPAWAQTVVMISLIFGGCCSNVCASSGGGKVDGVKLISVVEVLIGFCARGYRKVSLWSYLPSLSS